MGKCHDFPGSCTNALHSELPAEFESFAFAQKLNNGEKKENLSLKATPPTSMLQVWVAFIDIFNFKVLVLEAPLHGDDEPPLKPPETHETHETSMKPRRRRRTDARQLDFTHRPTRESPVEEAGSFFRLRLLLPRSFGDIQQIL